MRVCGTKPISNLVAACTTAREDVMKTHKKKMESFHFAIYVKS
jgi:hypothetical protein